MFYLYYQPFLRIVLSYKEVLFFRQLLIYLFYNLLKASQDLIILKLLQNRLIVYYFLDFQLCSFLIQFIFLIDKKSLNNHLKNLI